MKLIKAGHITGFGNKPEIQKGQRFIRTAQQPELDVQTTVTFTPKLGSATLRNSQC